MKQEVFEKEQRKYVAPWCEVIQVESTGFLCGVSVGLKKSESTDDDWDADQDIDGGEAEL
ncbi:hypothetical protein [Segatella oulorum]|uniref:Uncharacterized protein n=1 Tax=Segatella oulorum F0390 TaxID=702438 RepID=G1W8F4_9BACT|nr:hypothetical protein [Segatella oulorum]EGV28401.1 hypothetical protein HMPREF9431_00105 [Segatella oulorum F0390]